MQIPLTKHLTEFIQDKVNSGRYASVSDVIGEALMLLDQRDRIREAKLAELKAKIQEGIAELDRGEGLDGEEVFAELEADLQRMEAEMLQLEGVESK
ncbi:type II toxin-antitoxin system ParD family antitoxin [Planktothrix agardhii]|uniref:type II toxin-antitoxin system ParD family antitoxin n=1 Tax=Planktothrix agardhii TaxID=1160 RepID=UPI0003F9C504|nr:type II toxin-antitoxin system ParD family antitoxin [Planktothrix agardhii]MDS1347687.1 type II toxin-antitoxin system ParD family antitoxin [Planktothrix agardhii NRERC-751]